MSYRIAGIDPAPFRPLFGLSDEALAAHGAVRHVADAKPGYPDRVELRFADPGETLILINHEHQPADTPYRARHAIYVREGAERAVTFVGSLPETLTVAPISLRGFDAAGFMVEADLAQGDAAVEAAIKRLLNNRSIVYVHAHFAKQGCFAARIDRA
jgi:hypothetical protein